MGIGNKENVYTQQQEERVFSKHRLISISMFGCLLKTRKNQTSLIEALNTEEIED